MTVRAFVTSWLSNGGDMTLDCEPVDIDTPMDERCRWTLDFGRSALLDDINAAWNQHAATHKDTP